MSKLMPWDEPLATKTKSNMLKMSGIDPEADNNTIRILDFGCGNGRYLDAYAEVIPQNNLYGTEVDSDRIQQVQAKGYQVKQLNPERAKLPYEDQFFDVVFSSNVIEHIPNDLYLEYLKEVQRVLVDNGRFVVGTPNYPIKRLYDIMTAFRRPQFFRYYLFDDPTHINPLSIFRLEADLAPYFKEVHLRPTRIPGQGRLAILRDEDFRYRWRILGYKIAGYCIK